MKMLPLPWALSVLLPVAALGQPTAQPSLGMAIPLELKDSTVCLPHDFLLNPQTILPAGTQLISCFEPPKLKDADVIQKDKKEALERTFSRKPTKVSSLSEEERLRSSALVRAAAERAFGKTWTEARRFQVYFHQLSVDRYWIAFRRPNQPKPEVGQIEDWDGMYLGTQDGAVVVLAIEPDSRASRAGLTGGDRLLAINDLPVASLDAFRTAYQNGEKTAQKEGGRLALRVQPVEGEPREVVISVARSLTSDPFGDAAPPPGGQ